jgi:hypothetical protein
MSGPTELDPSTADGLLDSGNIEGARAALEQAPAGDERFTVVRIRLALYDGSMPSGAAMQKLIQLMRRDAEWPGAKALYQEASSMAYQSRESSVSHSHPPPPIRDKGED